MNGYRTLLISLFISLNSVCLFASDFPYILDSLSTDNGLSNNKVFSIYQDKKGFIWIGTGYGLNRYDGKVFKSYYHDPHDSTTLRNNYIWSILEDSHGNFWVGTADGLDRYDRIKDQFEDCTKQASASDSAQAFSVRLIMEDSFGEVWFGTTDGLKRYDKLNDSFFHYDINLYDLEGFAPNYVIAMYEDRKQNLWIGTFTGLFRYNRENDQLMHVESFYRALKHDRIYATAIAEDKTGMLLIGQWGSSSLCLFDGEVKGMAPISRKSDLNGVFYLFEDRQKRIWSATGNGLFVHDPDCVFSDDLDIVSYKFLNARKIRSFLEDESGTIWVGTQHHGIYRFVPRFKKFENYEPVLDGVAGANNYLITCIEEGEDGSLWLGTEGAKLIQFNPREKRFSLLQDRVAQNLPDVINSLFFDKDQILWFGSNWDNTLFSYNSKDNQAIFFEERFTENIYKFTALAEDEEGNLWCGTTHSGLVRFNKSTHHFTHFGHDPEDRFSLSNDKIAFVHRDRSGDMWIGTGGGGLNKYSGDGRFIRYMPKPENKNSLRGSILLSIHEDSDGNLWIGTANGGLNKYDPATGTFEHFGIESGFPSNRILAIVDDDAGNLWISTSEGISKFNPNTLEIRNYDKSDGLLHDDFDNVAACKCRSGELVFGGKSGFTIFHPENLRDNPHIPPVHITDFKILNKPVRLDTAINFKKHLSLSYDQNVFSFEFAGLNYIHPEKNQYQYKMDGFDPEWVDAGNRNYVSYSNLPPGDYAFKVKASNNDGLWNNQGASVRITITPPWWRTKLAYAFYVLALGIVLFGFYRFNMYRAGIKSELEMQRFEAHKMREIDEMKSNFFANISHEFRTPLTLILGPIEDFMTKSDVARYKDIFKRMRRNAYRLLQLINQLLDLSKIEAGSASLELQAINVSEFIRAYVNSFASWAERKKIDLKLNTPEDDVFGNIDTIKLEKILSNLISNAIKFTPDGGKIDVRVKISESTLTKAQSTRRGESNEQLELIVKDNGIGIPQELHQKVFDRFYQIDPTTTREYEGTGIGLSLTKELVELHGGKISLNSEINKGTTFTVKIPLDKTVTGSTVTGTGSGTEGWNIVEKTDHADDDEISATAGNNQNGRTLLVVDDNEDVRNYIGESLRDEYKILYASDGEQAIETAIDNIPDLIISDVMMPRMDGFAFCEQIKSNIQTSHIPVILLTAKASEQSKLEGLETGADDYLIKPFNREELKARTKNLILQRQRLREYFSRAILLEPGKLQLNSMDEEFFRKAIEIIKSHLPDDLFSVDDLAQQIGMSRQNLTRKLKAITGLSTQDFIRKVRLDQAAILLKSKSATITEIAYKVGFNSSAYFTKCFKEQFGCLPSEYAG